MEEINTFVAPDVFIFFFKYFVSKIEKKLNVKLLEKMKFFEFTEVDFLIKEFFVFSSHYFYSILSSL